MLKRFVVFSIIGVACLLAQDALAALDLNPPAWRGEPSSTYQVWDFNTDTNLVETDLTLKTWATIVYKDVFPASWIEEGGNQFVPWVPLDYGCQGIWYIGKGDWTMIHTQDTQDANPCSRLYLLDEKSYRYGIYLIAFQADLPLSILQILPQAYTICIDNMAFDVIPESINDGTIWGRVP